MRRVNTCIGLAACALLSLAGCGSSDDSGEAGRGSVNFTVWGEEFIEDGIPAEEFQDGWSVTFERFLITLGDVRVETAGGAEAGRIEGTALFDLVAKGPHPVGSFELAARAWDRVGYAVPAADAATEASDGASDADLDAMQDSGHSVYVVGSASLDDRTKTFAWGFTNTTRYRDCVAEIDGQEVHGVVIANGGDESVELTIHGDHFFYDDLASPDAVPRFEAMAGADTDDDGEVTLDELRAVKLVDIEEGTYGTGSRSHVDDLGAFVEALTTTLGHYRGEGHCVADDS
jgi:hypothetical protein